MLPLPGGRLSQDGEFGETGRCQKLTGTAINWRMSDVISVP
jgi:hypothetical protein